MSKLKISKLSIFVVNSKTGPCKMKWWEAVVEDSETAVRKCCWHVFQSKTKAGGRQQNGKEMFPNETWSAFSVRKMWIKAATRQGGRTAGRNVAEDSMIHRERHCDREIIFSRQCCSSICCFWVCSCLFKLVVLGRVVTSCFREDEMKTDVWFRSEGLELKYLF